MQHFSISHTNSYIFFLFIDNAICSYPQQGGSITNVNLAMACNGAWLTNFQNVKKYEEEVFQNTNNGAGIHSKQQYSRKENISQDSNLP